MHKVVIGLDGKYTVTISPRWAQARAEEETAIVKEAQPETKSVGETGRDHLRARIWKKPFT